MRIVPAGSDRDAYLPLLLLADDSESEVRGYYQMGDLYALDDESGPLGLILAIPEPDGSVELKAVAVDEVRHGQGIGERHPRSGHGLDGPGALSECRHAGRAVDPPGRRWAATAGAVRPWTGAGHTS